MGTRQRKTHWERVWSEKDEATTSWFQAAPAVSLDLIERSGTQPGDPVIDVGGGASRLVDHLLDGGFTDVTVLDISAAGLQRAQRRLGERAAAVHWIEADATMFRPRRTYRLWHDRAVFHFLLDAADVALTEAAVGAGISTVLFLGALALTSEFEHAPTPHRWLSLAVVTGEAVGMVFERQLAERRTDLSFRGILLDAQNIVKTVRIRHVLPTGI